MNKDWRFRRLLLRWTELEARIAPALFRVVTTADSGIGTLRQAILAANSLPGADTIGFQIPGSGTRTIAPLTSLPTITGLVTIDGFLQPDSRPNSLASGYDGIVRIEIEGSLAGLGQSGLVFGDLADGSILRGIAINHFDGSGVRLDNGASSITIEGCLIGTSADGLSAVGTGNAFGVESVGNNGNLTVGGAAPADRNIIAGNLGAGVQIGGGSSAVSVRNNHLGMLADFSAADNGGPAVNGPADVSLNFMSGPIIPGGPAAPTIDASVADEMSLTIDVSFVAQGDRDYRLELFAAGRPQAAVTVSMPAAGTTIEHFNLSKIAAPAGNLTATLTDMADKLTSSLSATVVIPLGQPDAYDVMQNAGVSGNVLSNDGVSESLTARLVTPPIEGAFQLFEDGNFGYSPLPGKSGLQSFLYVPSLGGFDGPPQSVQLAVHAGNIDEISTAQWDFDLHKGDDGGTNPLYGQDQKQITDPYIMEFGGGKYVGLADFSWGVSVVGGVAQSDLFSVTLPSSLNSPRFFANSASGISIPSVDFSLRGWYTGKQVEYCHITLNDVVISRFETSADTSTGTDTIALDFAKIELKARDVDSMGIPGPWFNSSWNRSTGTVTGISLPLFAETGSTTLKIDGGLQTNLSSYDWGLHQSAMGVPVREPFKAFDSFNTAFPGAIVFAVAQNKINSAAVTTTATYPWTQTWILSNVSFTGVTLAGNKGGLPEFDYQLDMTRVTSNATDGKDTYETVFNFQTLKGDGGGSATEQLIGSTKLSDEYVLTFNGVGGNQVPVYGFSWEMTNSGVANAGLLNLTIPAGGNSPNLFARCALGSPISSVELSLRVQTGGKLVEYGRMTLNDALIDVYHTSLADPPIDVLAFSFARITFDAREVDSKGVPGPWTETIWDVSSGTVSGTSLPSFTETGGTTLKIDETCQTDLLDFSWGEHQLSGKSYADPLIANDSFNIAFPATVGSAVAAKSYQVATLATDAPEGNWSHTWTFYNTLFTHVRVSGTGGGLPAFDYELSMDKVTSEATDAKNTYTTTWNFKAQNGDTGGLGSDPLIGSTKLTDPYVLTFNGIGKQVQILDFSWEVANTGTPNSGNVLVTIPAGPNSPRFFANSASKTVLTSVEISLQTKIGYGGQAVEYGRVTLSDVLIDSYRIDDGDPATDTLALNFAKIEIRARTFDQKGTTGPWVTADWNRATNAVSGTTLPVLTEGGALTLNVGSAQTNLSAFSWGVTSAALGKSTPDPIGATDTFNIATPSLMASVAAATNQGNSLVQAALPSASAAATWQGSNATFNHFVLHGSDAHLATVETEHAISKMISIVSTRGIGPVGKPEAYQMVSGQTLTVAAPGILANDLPWPGAGPMTAVLNSAPLGVTTFNANGSFSYTPPLGLTGTVALIYTPTQGTKSGNQTTVSIQITASSTLPNAKFDAGQFSSTGQFNVTYVDDVGVNVSTLDNADLYVEGPNGYSRTARFVEVNPPNDGTPRTATYAIDIPGGSWEPTDNGKYSFYLVANQVLDIESPPNAALPTLLGTVDIAVAPKVANVVINDGSPQRSMVKSVAIAFDSLVNLPPTLADAFMLERMGPGMPNGPVSLVVDTSLSTPLQTIARLTFNGPLSQFGSLIDGRYQLTVLANQVSAGGVLLDGNGDGNGGDHYVLASSGTSGIFRMYGDSDGDASVTPIDFIVFRQYFGGLIEMFDFDGDGAVAASDFIQFRMRFGGSI